MPGPRAIEPVPPTEGEADEIVPYGTSHERFWERCLPITEDCPVGRYLLGRGCPLPSPEADLRWRPDYPHLLEERWRGPLMVGRITDALSAEPMSFHFTWIQPNGAGKAPVHKPRLMAKGMAKRGGVVRLTDDAEATSWLMAGEGIETCLAAYGLATARWNLWACLDAGNLERLPYVQGIDRLLILADCDKRNRQTGKAAGITAAEGLVLSWQRQSRHSVDFRVVIGEQPGTDANDQALAVIGSRSAA